MPVITEGKLLTVKEVLELSGVSRNTLSRDIKSGKIATVHFGRNVRFKEDEAQAYAEEKKKSNWAHLHKEKSKDG